MSASRGFAFIAVGYAALLLTGAATATLPFRVEVPDLPLLIVLYLGLGTRGQGSAAAAAAVAVVLGYLTDLLAGAPRGLHAASFVLVMLVVRAGAGRLMVTRLWQEVVVSFFVLLAHGALVVALLAPLYEGEAALALRTVPWNALVTALLVAPLLFGLLRRIDRKLAPDPRGLRMPGA